MRIFFKLLKTAILFFFQLNVQAQQIQTQQNNEPVLAKASYVINYQPNTASIRRKTEQMILAISKNRSVFYSTLAASSDSLINTLTASSTQYDIQNVLNIIADSPKKDFSYVVFKKYTDKSTRYVQEIESKLFEQVDKNFAYQWVLQPNDTATINGYACQKAVTVYAGRTYTAWYTRQIPIADGPYKFSGLPGLIVKITDTNQHYDFKLTSFAVLTNPGGLTPPALPDFTIPATMQEIYKAQVDELYKIANNQTSASVTATQRTAMLRKIQDFTNRLELE